MGTNNLIFLEVLEWFDEAGNEIVHRIPDHGSAEIKYGAQLIVRESQSAVFFYNGKAYEAFPPGRHTLKTANIPLLTKALSLPWGLTSPLRAEVYFVNMKVFANLKWGTRDPVAFKDRQLGLIRLRAFGVCNIQVIQPVLFINSLAGTQSIFSTAAIEEYLSRVIVSRFNDYLGEHLDSMLSLPGRYDEIAGGLKQRLRDDCSRFGLGLQDLYINAITPPPEVQQAIDDKSRLSVFDDLNKLMQMKAAMAFEKAAAAGGEAGSGMGLGLGLMLPAMFSAAAQQTQQHGQSWTCPECHGPVDSGFRFCPACGHQLLVFGRCRSCGKNIPPSARFCPRCGQAAERLPQEKQCPHCRSDNLPESIYCNQCGEKIE
jgi:membrane protease subunit (stomatin/prohibitin family)